MKKTIKLLKIPSFLQILHDRFGLKPTRKKYLLFMQNSVDRQLQNIDR